MVSLLADEVGIPWVVSVGGISSSLEEEMCIRKYLLLYLQHSQFCLDHQLLVASVNRLGDSLSDIFPDYNILQLLCVSHGSAINRVAQKSEPSRKA